MVKHGGALWSRHPHVANNLTLGERAADVLKAAFGTWSLLGAIIGGIAFWLLLVNDPGELRLNLGLSFLASVQGVILQIAANRGDRLNAQVALHTQANTDELMSLNRRQLAILEEIKQVRALLAADTTAQDPGATGAST